MEFTLSAVEGFGMTIDDENIFSPSDRYVNR